MSTRDQLNAALQLWMLYTRRAMRATPSQMQRLERKIDKLKAQLRAELEQPQPGQNGA